MARIRGVKPELFRHEGLQDLGELAMLIFIGLFTQADKEGRFCWNVRQLKLDLLPFIDYDLGVTLSALSEAGFIAKYVVNGKSYGVIPGFKTHQYTTGKEPDSKLPAPPDMYQSMTRTCSEHASSFTGHTEERITGHTEERIPGHTGSESESEEESEREPEQIFSRDSGNTKKKRRFSQDDIEKVRLAYPLKKAPADARKAIERALAIVADRGETDPVGFLLARIDAMKAARLRDEAKEGAFVPHLAYPASWFNKACYDEEALQPLRNCVLPDGKPCTAAELQAQTGWTLMRGEL
jgi:hypothetical protein